MHAVFFLYASFKVFFQFIQTVETYILIAKRVWVVGWLGVGVGVSGCGWVWVWLRMVTTNTLADIHTLTHTQSGSWKFKYN
jgi:hypothetical protein